MLERGSEALKLCSFRVEGINVVADLESEHQSGGEPIGTFKIEAAHGGGGPDHGSPFTLRAR